MISREPQEMIPRSAHAAIICGMTNSGKTYMMLNLYEKFIKGYHDNVIIICPTYYDNKTYQARKIKGAQIITDIKDGKFSQILESIIKLHSHGGKRSGQKTLVIIDDCSAETDLDKRRGALSELAFSGRHINITTWFLSQRYVNVPKNFRDNIRWLYITKNTCKKSFQLMMDENDIIDRRWHEQIKTCLLGTHQLFIDLEKSIYYLYHK